MRTHNLLWRYCLRRIASIATPRPALPSPCMAIRQTPFLPAVAQSPSPSLSSRRSSGRQTFASFAVERATAARLTQSLGCARPTLVLLLAAVIVALLLLVRGPHRGGFLFAPQSSAADDAPHEALLAAALAELRRAREEGRAEEVVAAQEAVLARQQALLRRYWRQLTRLTGQRGGKTGRGGPIVGSGEQGKAEVGGGEFVGTRHEGCGGGESTPREQAVAEAEMLEWRPQEDSYLLAACVYGRMTNRLLCLRNYILAATLLRRPLIVPAEDLYRPARRWNSPLDAPLSLDVVFNASHLNACLGRRVAVTLRDYLRAANATRLDVDPFVCWADRCAFQRGRPSHPAIRFASRRQAGLEANVTRRTFTDAYGGAGGRVLCLGDLYESHARFLDPPPGFTSSLATAWAMPPLAPPPAAAGARDAGGGLAGGGGSQLGAAGLGMEQRCRSLVWPCDAVVQAAEGFVREVSGGAFAALHLRRDDMFRHCVGQGKCPYWAQRQAGECVREKLLGGAFDAASAQHARHAGGAAWAGRGAMGAFPGRPLLFLASDTSDSDLAVFLSALQGVPLLPHTNTTTASASTASTASSFTTPTPASLAGLDSPEAVVVVRLPSLEGKMWAERLNREGLAGDAVAVAVVEKVVCAMSRLFLTTPGSTFSHHIMHLRIALHTASCHDGGFCHGLMDPEPV
ncbi:unnamed protein product [Closterium sp. Naga37s-1]|nr:unnamed protein product [Closterium sp. Naga37s-1]